MFISIREYLASRKAPSECAATNGAEKQQTENPMTKLNFKTRIRYDGARLKISLPESLYGKRFEAYYANRQIVLALSTVAHGGVKSLYGGTKQNPYYYVQFGPKWVGKDMPRFNIKTDVVMEDGKIVFHIPEQSNTAQETPISHSKEVKRTYTKKSDTLTAALNMLNKYSAENGYEWEVVAGKASLIKSHRIG